MKKTTTTPDRRDFLRSSAAMSVGFWAAGGISPRPTRSKLEKIRFGCIGVGNKGFSDSADAARFGEIVAICDIDDATLAKRKENPAFKSAKTFHDFREMLDKLGDQIDAVTVSTPDHTHAVATLQAIQSGMHCYTQKPLTHSIEEARVLSEAAREAGVVTQMGNQGTANSTLRQSAAVIRKGLIGAVKEVHVWTNRPVWPQSVDLKVKEAPQPGEEAAWESRRKQVKWDLWLGPAKQRPYSPEIHPFNWRGFWDFGTGALGDMACHTLNMAYMALDLKFPTEVRSVQDKHDGVCFPAWSEIEFDFPATEQRGEVKMVWYDGGRRPPAALFKGLPKQKLNSGPDKHYSSGAILVGEKGLFYSPGDYGGNGRHTGLMVDGEFTRLRDIVRQGSNFSEFQNIEFQRSPGHFDEFAAAINAGGGAQPVSNFPDYAGPLTETILLGNLAIWEGKQVPWDAKTMVASGVSEAAKKLVRHDYPDGFTIHNAVPN